MVGMLADLWGGAVLQGGGQSRSGRWQAKAQLVQTRERATGSQQEEVGVGGKDTEPVSALWS